MNAARECLTEKVIPPAPVKAALENLFEVAQDNTHESRYVANFLLAWWNAEEYGGFDLIELWSLSPVIARDLALVFSFLANHPNVYPDSLGGYGATIRRIASYWRRKR